MKVWIKNSIAGAVFVLGIGGTIAYTQYLSPKLNDESVWVAAHPIAQNQKILLMDLRQEQWKKSQVPVDAIYKEKNIVGKRAAVDMVSNDPFTTNNTEMRQLTPSAGQYIAQIPSSWLISVPDSLRRGDEVNIFSFHKIKTSLSNPSNSTVKTTSQNKKTTPLALVSNSTNPVLQNIMVEYVHNGSNREIQNTDVKVKGTVSTRQNGSAVPSTLELLLTPKQFQALEQAVENQKTLDVVYVQPKVGN